MPLEQFPLAQLGAAGVQPQQAQPPLQQAVLAHLQGDAALWQQQHVALGPLQQGQQQIQAAEGARNPRWSDAQGTERWGLAQAARMGASDDPNPPRDGFTSAAAHDAWYDAQVAQGQQVAGGPPEARAARAARRDNLRQQAAQAPRGPHAAEFNEYNPRQQTILFHAMYEYIENVRDINLHEQGLNYSAMAAARTDEARMNVYMELQTALTNSIGQNEALRLINEFIGEEGGGPP